MEDQVSIYLAAVPVLGIAAQWLAWRLGLPSILLLLTFGVALGEVLSAYTGSREVVDSQLLFPLVSLSVGVILFEGGMSLQVRELRESGAAVLGLVTIGTAISWGLSTAAVSWIMGVSLQISAVIGAILVVTGPTVVSPLLRMIRPSRRIAATVKWESIVIDPVGAALAVLAFGAFRFSDASEAFAAGIVGVLLTLLIGLLVGGVGAYVLVLLMRRYLVPDFLHSPVFLAAAILVFSVSNRMQHESGLLGVTVMGVLLGNQRWVPVRHVIEFKENLQVLLIACLFIVLGSRVDPRDVVALGWPAVWLLAALIVVVRPAAVFLSTWGARLNWRERVFLAFLAPRGIVAAAVASVFALQLSELSELSQQEAAGAQLSQEAGVMVSLTFLVIAATVAIYGLLAPVLARKLRLSEARPQGLLLAGASPWIRDLAKLLQKEDLLVMLIDTNYSHVAAARMAGLNAHCASILAEYVHEELDMAGLGRLLALTPNDEVNTLASREFFHLFGRQNTYQLPPPQAPAGHRQEKIADHMRGRLLFSESLSHDEIVRRLDFGAQIKATHISDTFTFEDFRQRYGDSAEVLFVKDESGKLLVRTCDSDLTPKPGQSVIALVDAPAAEQDADAGQPSQDEG